MQKIKNTIVLILILVLISMNSSMIVFAGEETFEKFFTVYTSGDLTATEASAYLAQNQHYVSHRMTQSSYYTNGSRYGVIITYTQYVSDFDEGSVPDEWKELMKEKDALVAGLLGFATMTSVLIFIIHFMKLGAMPSHPIARRDVMMGIVWSGVITAILGGIDIFMVILYLTILG